jgi:hypothetical protein
MLNFIKTKIQLRKKEKALKKLRHSDTYQQGFKELKELDDFNINSESIDVISNYWKFGSAYSLIEEMKKFDNFNINVHTSNLLEKFENTPKGNLISLICECNKFSPKKSEFTTEKIINLLEGEKNYERDLDLVTKSILSHLDEKSIVNLIEKTSELALSSICTNLSTEAKQKKNISHAIFSRWFPLRMNTATQNEDKSITREQTNRKAPSLKAKPDMNEFEKNTI